MDLFKFTHPTKTNLTYGVPIHGYSSAMWVERYRDAGEFEIEAPMSSGLWEFLPLGTIISHVDTYDACIVENHEITEEKDAEATIKISGRTFDAWLENRVLGSYFTHGTSTPPFVEYALEADNTWDQAVLMINNHISTDGSENGDIDDSLNDDILAVTNLSGSGISETRTIKRGSLHTRVMEVLALEDLGLRFVRKNPSGTIGDTDISQLLVHRGIDRSSSIIFSSANGDIDSAQYLWTMKKMKNAALVQGRYVELLVLPTATGYDRRVMFVDASDIDGSLTTVPSGGTLTSIQTKMQRRGRQALAQQNEIDIAQIDISSLVPTRYRRDYDIGDIVSVNGNYGTLAKRRVVEYVEIEDENGESGHPTLAVLGE